MHKDRNLRRDDRGAVAVFATLIMVVLVLAAGLTVDLGHQRFARRDAQADADVIALDMSRLADGRTLAEISGSNQDLSKAAFAASAANNGVTVVQWDKLSNGELILNGQDDVVVALHFGWFSATGENRCLHTDPVLDAPIPAGSGYFDSCVAGNDVPNAARVTVTNSVDFLLLPVGDGPSRGGVSRTAVASHGELEQAQFRLGSSVASVNPSSNYLIGQLLNQYTDSTCVACYDGLANTEFEIDNLSPFLPDIDGNISAASPEELSNSQVRVEDLAVATANALRAGDPSAADLEVAAALEDFVARASAELSNAGPINLADAIGAGTNTSDACNPDPETGTTVPAAGTTVNVGQLMIGALFLIDCDHFVTIPGSTVNVPGIGDVGVRMTGIESPRIIGDHDGASGLTRQVGLSITPTIDLSSSTSTRDLCLATQAELTDLASKITPLDPTLDGIIASLLSALLGPCGLLGGAAHLPIDIHVTATPTIDLSIAKVLGTQSIHCESNQLQVQTTPAIVDLLADVTLDVSATVRNLDGNPVVTYPIAHIVVPASAGTTGGPGDVMFTGINPIDLSSSTMYQDFDPSSAWAGSNPVGLSNLLQVGPSTINLAQDSLDLDQDGDTTDPVDGDDVINPVLAQVQTEVNELLAELDAQFVIPLVETLGIHLGGAHIMPQWMQCDQSGLALVG